MQKYFRKPDKKCKAFTLLEIVVVLVVISIVSIVAMPKLERNEIGEAATQLVDHIRYTRHMAMSENKFEPSESEYATQIGSGESGYGKYQLSFWQIRFIKRLNSNPKVIGYTIYSDRDRKGNVDTNTHIEPAINQLDRKLIHGYGNPDDQKVSKDSFLNLRYSIVDIELSASCLPNGYSKVSNDIGAISFDYNGRPYAGVSSSRATELALKDDCNITITGKNYEKKTITIQKCTGYAFIPN